MRSPQFVSIAIDLASAGHVSIRNPVAADFFARDDEAGWVLADHNNLDVDQSPFGDVIVRGTAIMGALRNHLSGYPFSDAATLRVSGVAARERGRDQGAAERPVTLADVACGSEAEELAEAPEKDNGQVRQAAKRALAPSALRVVNVESEASQADGSARVAINRFTGAPMTSKLFQGSVATDVKLSVLLTLDVPILVARLGSLNIASTPKTVVDDVLAALTQWRPLIGGQVSNGAGVMGRPTIMARLVEDLDLGTLLGADTSLKLLQTAGEAMQLPPTTSTVTAPEPDSGWEFSCELRATDPLLVSPTKVTGGAHDNIHESSDVVPSSTWRGLFRSRAEYILRTCGVAGICEASETACGRCAVCALFGSPPRDVDASGGSIGRITFERSKIKGHKVDIDHAPIDRFTGGAADGKLFQNKAFQPGSTLTLTIRQTRPGFPVPEWTERLLSLVLLDIHDGLVGLGHSTTRGYGTLEVVGELPEWPTNGDWLKAIPGTAPAKEAAHA